MVSIPTPHSGIISNVPTNSFKFIRVTDDVVVETGLPGERFVWKLAVDDFGVGGFE
jgi:hypothetical protein